MSSYQQVVTDEVLAQIESKSDEQRANRQMSAEVVQSLKDCGFYRMMLPKKWGGMECKPQEFFAEQIRIAEADEHRLGQWHYCRARLSDSAHV